MTKWWKCDLQVATPAWNFSMPSDTEYNLSSEAGRIQFAERYMDELVSKRIEVVVLADHNTGEWIDVMVSAGERKNVIVFPGCEVTTGSGSDGIHIIIIGDRTKTSHDFDLLLAGTIGFNADHPRFHQQGDRQLPGSSSNTVLQILDALPDDYLAIAPHCLNQNGLASGNTAQGDIRWKALHHPRLAAIDPGNCSSTVGSGFNEQFRGRRLDRFPRLRDIAFVSTSDAYALANLGSRFSWIRMEQPSLESFRQAFLDHEARIICDWDSRLSGYVDSDPNNIRHGWIKSVSLNGILGNSESPLTLDFHHGLNVIIGGRGSGKSTVVAAIRRLYSGFSTLPQMVGQEAEDFSKKIFSLAQLSATHLLPNSQEQQQAMWSDGLGALTQGIQGPPVSTSFRVRVVNQKELFERVSHDRHDPLAASRSFLAFVDESLGFLKTNPVRPESWWRRFEDASAEWMTATREHQKSLTDLAQLPSIRATIRDLEAQVAAFDSPEAKSRRQTNSARIAEREVLKDRFEKTDKLLEEIRRLGKVADSEQIAPSGGASAEVTGLSIDLRNLLHSLEMIEDQVRENLRSVTEQAQTQFDEWRERVKASSWAQLVADAENDHRAYVAELVAKGIDPDAYTQLTDQLKQQVGIEKLLAGKESQLAVAQQKTTTAWQRLKDLLDERRETRTQLLTNVTQRSGRLKFELRPHRDSIGWANEVRKLLNLRADGFLEDVPETAEWIWEAVDDATRGIRWAMWRNGLIKGELSQVASTDNANMRSAWQKRLESLDETLRLRLASEVADDSVQISFLKDGGLPTRADDWQDITQGSPGQRTAAMLGFVLHHGDEPLVLDQPEDDLDTEWISNLVVRELRASRWKRQLIVVTHNANIPVNGDAERVLVLENNAGSLRIRQSSQTLHGIATVVQHCGAIELPYVRKDIQNIMEGGIPAFMQREKKYNNEVKLTSALSNLST
jgi:DNA repair ATPase RecN